ncbi:MAG: sulfotransferase family protein [Phenylobacterium sp.]|nr:sulfotransferase family protein [Phenylobacterium sp.]
MNADQLVERAHRQTGVDSFHSQSFREGLEILVADANRGGQYNDKGVDYFEAQATHFLSVRLKLDDYIRRNPEVLEVPIKAPVVVLGIPRTGTTLASNLLATDPARRSILTWEADDPVPPPTAETLFTDPRALAALEAERERQALNPEAGRFYMSSAVFPTECTFIQAHDFKSLFWESHGRLPGYAEWVLSCDMTSAYDHHRRFLQVLQQKAPGAWNLKMPSHALHIRWLLEAYPDARMIWTHRDPFTVTGSLCSLISNTHLRLMDEPDLAWVAQNYPPQLAEHANRVMRKRKEIGHDRIFDLHYADMTRDPIATMRRLYAWLGDAFTPEVEAGMRAWLQANPQGKWGKHAYRLEQWGLSPEKLRPHFADYLAEYDIEREGA